MTEEKNNLTNTTEETEEESKNFSTQETVKKAHQATLEMAKEWHKSSGTIHHAIEAYDDVILVDPESAEADEARQALLEIAKKWKKEGRKYEAIRLYKKLMTDK